MKMKFIGKDGSMSFRHGRVYDVVVTITYSKNISLQCDELKVRCPYGSMDAFLKNWEKVEEEPEQIRLEETKQMKRLYMIPIITVIICLSLAVGIGLGIRISNSTEKTEYCKECPMCGSSVELNPVQHDWYIECQNRNCGLKTGFFHNKEELIEKWNNM